MITLIIVSLVYLLGLFLCYTMQRVEHEAEGTVYTKGDRVLNIFLSLFSWVWVLVILIKSWFTQISKTGYWTRPVKPQPETEIPTE